VRASLSISIKKRIPIAAGLGGGSADAAATLVAMTRLYGLDPTAEELSAWAGNWGRMLPFFLGGRWQEGRGKGDILRPIRLYSLWWAVLLSPPVFLSAREVYGGFGLDIRAQRG